MKTTLDSDLRAVLAPFQLSEQGETLLEAIRHEYMVTYYEGVWGGIEEIEVVAVPRTNRPTLHIKAYGENGGRTELYYYVRSSGGKITLTEYDLPNVQRCSLDQKVRSRAGPSC